MLVGRHAAARADLRRVRARGIGGVDELGRDRTEVRRGIGDRFRHAHRQGGGAGAEVGVGAGAARRLHGAAADPGVDRIRIHQHEGIDQQRQHRIDLVADADRAPGARAQSDPGLAVEQGAGLLGAGVGIEAGFELHLRLQAAAQVFRCVHAELGTVVAAALHLPAAAGMVGGRIHGTQVDGSVDAHGVGAAAVFGQLGQARHQVGGGSLGMGARGEGGGEDGAEQGTAQRARAGGET